MMATLLKSLRRGTVRRGEGPSSESSASQLYDVIRSSAPTDSGKGPSPMLGILAAVALLVVAGGTIYLVGATTKGQP